MVEGPRPSIIFKTPPDFGVSAAEGEVLGLACVVEGAAGDEAGEELLHPASKKARARMITTGIKTFFTLISFKNFTIIFSIQKENH